MIRLYIVPRRMYACFTKEAKRDDIILGKYVLT